MRAIICGGRDYTMTAYDWLRIDAIHDARCADEPGGAATGAECGPIECVYEGEADGADICGRAWAESRGVPWLGFPADWYPGGGALDRGAGHRRNADMCAGRHSTGQVPPPELVIAAPGGPGTASMVSKMRAAGRRVYELREPWQRWDRADVEHLRGGRMAYMERWLERGGGGPPIISAHLLKVGGEVAVPGDLSVVYCGRGSLRAPDGAPLCGTGLLGNPIKVEHVVTANSHGGKHVPSHVRVFDEITGDRADLPFAEVLERYRGYLRRWYTTDPRVRELLLTIRPWTLLVCWCPASSPCHAMVIADAAMQAQAAEDIRRRGLALPAKHWSAYRPRGTEKCA